MVFVLFSYLSRLARIGDSIFEWMRCTTIKNWFSLLLIYLLYVVICGISWGCFRIFISISEKIGFFISFSIKCELSGVKPQLLLRLFVQRYSLFLSFVHLFVIQRIRLAQRPVNVKSRPRLPIPDDEDPYSIAGNNCINNETSDSSGYSGSSNSNGESIQCINVFISLHRVSSLLSFCLRLITINCTVCRCGS